MTAGGGSARRPVVIGIDIGTTNSKGVACLPDGTVLATVRIEHRVSSPQPGWFEHDAEAIWWGDTVRVARSLMADLGPDVRVEALAVTTCGPCIVPVDAAGRALRPGILYGVDTRATRQAEALRSRIGTRAIQRLSRVPLASQAVGPKIAWVVAHEPAVARLTALWHTATSFIVTRLTGVAAIDHHQASAFSPFIDARRRAWDLRHAAGLDLEGRLPPLRWPGEIAGALTAGAAAATGLPAGTPVLVGTSDGPTEALAVGASRPGIVAVAYGSTTTLTTFGPATGPHRGLWDSEGWSPDERCVGGGLATSGAAVDWLRRELARDLSDQVDAAGSVAHVVLDREAAASPVGANRLLALPSFSGERSPIDDPAARGVLAGLTLSHTRGDVHRAILEGIAFGIREILETFVARGIPVERLRAAGGGVRSALGVQIVSDVTGREQEIAEQTIGAAYGAACLAARAVGLGPADDDAWFRVARLVRPDRRASTAYDRRYALFRRLQRDTRSVVHALAASDAAPVGGQV